MNIRGYRSSGMWHRVFSVSGSRRFEGTTILRNVRNRSSSDSVTSQKTWTFGKKTVRTWNLQLCPYRRPCILCHLELTIIPNWFPRFHSRCTYVLLFCVIVARMINESVIVHPVVILLLTVIDVRNCRTYFHIILINPLKLIGHYIYIYIYISPNLIL